MQAIEVLKYKHSPRRAARSCMRATKVLKYKQAPRRAIRAQPVQLPHERLQVVGRNVAYHRAYVAAAQAAPVVLHAARIAFVACRAAHHAGV